MKLEKSVVAAIIVLTGLVVTVSGYYGYTLWTQTEETIFEDITPSEAYAMIQNTNLFIIDVRTSGEYVTGHIAYSVNIDYRSELFREEISKLNKNIAYIVYCKSGVRSEKAMGIMEELGFKEVYNMIGGINQWISKGYPIVES